MADEPELRRPRRGTETRRRTETLSLRLLPAEQRALKVLADRSGHRSVQAWILDTIGPYLEGVNSGANSTQLRRMQ